MAQIAPHTVRLFTCTALTAPAIVRRQSTLTRNAYRPLVAPSSAGYNIAEFRERASVGEPNLLAGHAAELSAERLMSLIFGGQLPEVVNARKSGPLLAGARGAIATTEP